MGRASKPGEDDTSRACDFCGAAFFRTTQDGPVHWAARRFCSRTCSNRATKVMVVGFCAKCGKCFQPSTRRQRHCSLLCSNSGKPVKHGNYRTVRVRRRRTPAHRYAMEQHIGRRLKWGEYVHHINGDRQDNRIENLMVVNAREHSAFHTTGRPRATWSEKARARWG